MFRKVWGREVRGYSLVEEEEEEEAAAAGLRSSEKRQRLQMQISLK